MAITVNRKSVFFSPDSKRVIVRFFMPGGEQRAKKIIKRIMQLTEEEALLVLNQILRDFSGRHRNITKIFSKHFNKVTHLITEVGFDVNNISNERQLLMGAYFTHEYSIESAAFFNPSMVEDPDQSHLQKGQKRVIVSFRATGEGHVSSIVFRGGIIDEHNNLEFQQAGKLVDEAESIKLHVYNKKNFIDKLADMDLENYHIINDIFDPLGESFPFRELRQRMNSYLESHQLNIAEKKVMQAIQWIANGQYEIRFSLDTAISDRVIFPVTDTESNGIEDARFVRFIDDDGSVKYYATYTAYNGFVIMPQLIETTDFYRFKIMPIYGKYAQNKGMGLFPRKINGQYVMLSRNDGENNYIMFSDQINIWDAEPILLQEPLFPWEFVQLGNSGSPIETEHGWLVITHGVGAMRRYCLGAIMLDKNDPQKIIGQLSTPLLMPNEKEREGYVPNVVYSCGSIIHNEELIIPYAMSDYSSGFASVSLKELYDKMALNYAENESVKQSSTKKILLVDDDIISQEIIAEILISGGYEVETASDGIQAIVEIGRKKFDLVLSDITMPNFTGYQLLEFLQNKNISVPVVLLTGHVSEQDEIKGLKSGAIEYLRKPIDADILLLRLEKIFGGK